MKTITVKHSLFGKLILHEETGTPREEWLVAYIDFGDGKLHRAFWVSGQWVRDTRAKVTKPVVRYYEVRKSDGTPLF